MAKKNHNGILAKMLAAFARDAEPDELEEAVDAIEEITTEEVEVPGATPEGKDEDPMKTIMDRLDALEAKIAAKDEDPEEDPMAKLEQDLDELEGKPAAEGEEEEIITPDEDPDEPEAHFVDPEQINEKDEDEVVEGLEEEEIPTSDKRACDAARAALRVVKPVLASLPPSQRKRASDAAVAAIRKMSGLDSKSGTNGYLALKRPPKRKAADSSSKDLADIGKNIMAKRNPQYKGK